MALQMVDQGLEQFFMSVELLTDNTEKSITDERALPPESPLSMPRHGVYEQGLSMRHNQRTFFYILRTLVCRVFVLAVMLGLSYYGITEIYGVLSTTNNVTYLQWLFLILFSINFLWVSFAFAQALLGFLLHLKPRLIRQNEREADFTTAILLPIYNEDPIRIKAALKVMRDDLLAQAPGKFAFFILSDTNKADAWIAEEQAFLELINKDAAACPVYYRRRQQNTERKAGNIGDWVQRWGGAYEAMIVLDADSVMSADCMLRLSQRLAASPGVGLIQTLPTIVRANTLYGRLQQFANLR
jgi:membrane glycosyltransferase